MRCWKEERPLHALLEIACCIFLDGIKDPLCHRSDRPWENASESTRENEGQQREDSEEECQVGDSSAFPAPQLSATGCPRHIPSAMECLALCAHSA